MSRQRSLQVAFEDCSRPELDPWKESYVWEVGRPKTRDTALLRPLTRCDERNLG